MEPCGLEDEKIPSCDRRAEEETYVPSGRFDWGMTRSRVPGSTAMPDGVVSGYRGGFDMAQLWEEREEDQVETGVALR